MTNINRAYELGRQASKEGRPAVPALDAEVMALYKETHNSDLFRAFSRGYQDQNDSAAAAVLRG